MKGPRYWQIDFVRSLALIGMIAYHLLFDLYFLHRINLNPLSPPLVIFARLIAITFLLLVGISFFLSNRRAPTPTKLFLVSLRRSLLIFLSASLVTVVTFLVDPNLTVRFGILHLIAASLLLLLPLSLVRSSFLLLLISLIFLLVPASPPAFSSFDYYPVFPWFGVVLAGFTLARKIPWPKTAGRPKPFLSPLLFLGRHSLAVYLLHQPLLFLLLSKV